MKKIFIILLSAFVLTGCSMVRIDTTNINTILNVVLSKENKLYNTTGKGYKYYSPRGVSYIDATEYNEKLYSNGNYYYLYIDINNYYYKKEVEYEENKDAYFSRKLDFNNNQGYLEINKYEDGLYLIEYLYNYAKIEAIVSEEDINEVVLNATYILSSMKYNDNVIKIALNDDKFSQKEERYDIFTPKKTNDNFIKFNEE